MRRLATLCALAAACSSGRPIAILDSGPAASPASRTVETWNVGLGERTEPTLVLRRPYVLEAIAGSTADLLCLQGVYRPSDRALIVDAAKLRLPHVARFDSDLASPIDDPEDDTGAIPAAPTTPPCAGEKTLAALEPAHQCLTKNCSTSANDDAGYLTTTRCLRYNCLSELYALLEADPRCFACARMVSQDFPLIQARRTCAEDPRAGYAFAGQNDVMLLSRDPIVSSKLYVLPSTDYRRSVLHAKLSTGMHVFCSSLTAPHAAVDLPYTGRYGGGATGINAWINENLLQTKKLLALVEKLAGSEPAIVLGDLRTGPEYGMTVTAAPTFRSWELFSGKLTLGTSDTYTPICTRCPDNPLTGGTPPYWLEHILLRGVGRPVLTSRVYSDAVVPSDGKLLARSFDYGIRSVVTVK